LRTIFFLPGTGASPAFWKPVGDRLPAEWSKHYLGYPGLGDEPADPVIGSYDDLVRMIEARFGNGPVDLVAQSMGGFIAARLALAHPGKVRRLVLAATSGGIDIAPFGVADWRPDYRKAYPNAAPWITAGRSVPHLPVEKIACPTLLLWADADPSSPLAIGRYLATQLPDATLHIVKSTDHRFVTSHAAETAPLIEAHLT
jgi:pimeloyl-ACP methyl ester carboxylesterase